MWRKNLAVTLGFLLTLTAVGSAAAAGNNPGPAQPAPAVTEVRGTVLSVAAVCPAIPTGSEQPSGNPQVPCNGLQPDGYAVVVKNEAGQESTLSYAPNAKFSAADGAVVSVADLRPGTLVAVNLLDGKPVSGTAESTTAKATVGDRSHQDKQSADEKDSNHQDKQSGDEKDSDHQDKQSEDEKDGEHQDKQDDEKDSEHQDKQDDDEKDSEHQDKQSDDEKDGHNQDKQAGNDQDGHNQDNQSGSNDD